MSDGAVTLDRNDLVELMETVARTLTRVTRDTQSLPTLYAFPEDIVTILRGKVAEKTVREWKTKGYLRTIKVGIRSFVKPSDWDWFLEHHKELMRNNEDSRTVRFGGRG